MSEIEEKINKINKVLDTSYLNDQVQDSKQIKSYYQTNKIAYKLFHNSEGYLHMGLSRSGVYSPKDLVEPLLEIERLFTKNNTQNVLELASGHGANSYFLANRNPDINFRLLDLSTKPSGEYLQPKNIEFSFGDFHNLSSISDNSMDLVFIIEALCHSESKLKVLEEVKRVLKKDGFFVIYDGYLGKQENKLSNIEKQAVKLTEKGMAVNKFEELDIFKSYIKESGLQIKEEEDLSKLVLPTLQRFERLAKAFFKFPILSRFLKIILPEKFIRNSLSGYLMPSLINKRIGVYYKHVLQK